MQVHLDNPGANMYKTARSDFTPSRGAFLVRKSSGKRVLHIGPCNAPYTRDTFGKGELLYEKIDAVAKEQLGVDIDGDAASYINSHPSRVSKVLVADMNEEKVIDFAPDVIVFGETLEHLMNLGVALDTLKKSMSKETELIITVPNALHYVAVIYAFFNKESLHPDHSVTFTCGTLNQLLLKKGLHIKELRYTMLRDKHQMTWKGKLFLKFCSLFPMFSEDIIAVVVKK